MTDSVTLLERTLRGRPGPRVPVWIMRQAGRYLPEYRALRREVDFLTATHTPELAAEITLQPLRRFALDAAIIFSDIMTPLGGMGVDVDFAPGPVIERPLRTPADVRALRPLEPEEHTGFVLDEIAIVRRELSAERAVIGFAGAPFTLFCYLVEGGGSKDFMRARAFLRSEPAAAGALLDLLGRSMARYLVAQARAGADVLMLFDSWVGVLAAPEYRRFVLPVLQETVRAIRAEVDRPVIYFANGASTLLEQVAEVGADALGVDWTLSLSDVVRRLGPDTVVQGNLDPAALFADRAQLGAEIEAVLRAGRSAAGHVFNLGHGIHRDTDPDQVAFLVETVRERSSSGHAASAGEVR